MNTHPGLIGKKLGNTQVFQDDGNVVRVTVLQVGPCVVLGRRTLEKDGYSALILGFDEAKPKGVRKPAAAFFTKIGVTPKREIREFRLPEDVVSTYSVGQSLKPSELFTAGQHVDVSGTSKGRGFQGVMKRWNFKGSKSQTHGTHEYQRHAGSIGTNMTPGRTLANLKMAGQMGNEKITILNLKVARIVDDKNLVLIEGAVPGPRNGIVTVRAAVKKRGKSAAKAD
jgi:large subunit ribosomal protein L3